MCVCVCVKGDMLEENEIDNLSDRWNKIFQSRIRRQIEGKGCPVTCQAGIYLGTGMVQVQLYPYLTMALERRPGTQCTGGWVGLRAGMGLEYLAPHQGSSPGLSNCNELGS